MNLINLFERRSHFLNFVFGRAPEVSQKHLNYLICLLEAAFGILRGRALRANLFLIKCKRNSHFDLRKRIFASVPHARITTSEHHSFICKSVKRLLKERMPSLIRQKQLNF